MKLLTLLLLITQSACGGWTNWAGNIKCHPQRLVRPKTEAELRAAIKSAARVRVVGAGHSFNALACTSGVMIDTRALNKVLAIDEKAPSIRVEAGISLRELDEVVAQHGLALATEPTISTITAAGAIATASHGTDLTHGSLSEEVTALEVFNSRGEKLTIDDPDELRAARIGLGALGVIYSVTFRLVPAFNLAIQEQLMEDETAFSNLEQLLVDNQHVDLFWFQTEHKVFLRTYNRTTAARFVPTPVRDWWDEWVVRTGLARIGLALASKSTKVAKLLNHAQPSFFRSELEVDRSDRIFHRFPGHQKVYSMEYVIPIEHTRDALRAITAAHAATGFIPNISPYLRFIGGAGDGDLSPMRGRQNCAIEVLSYVGFKGWEPFFRNLEPRFLALGGRPHWGKLFYANPHALYPAAAWAHVEKLRAKLDPDGKFQNDLTRTLFEHAAGNSH